MTVGLDGANVEADLRAGRLRCPVEGCGSVLAPWGWARERTVRGVGRLRPRRSRCVGCRRTHVLLPVSVLLRRADAVTVIGAALLAKTSGWGHRRVAARLGLPASTVRGWSRRIAVVADRVLAVLAAVAAELGTEFVPPWPTNDPGASVVEFVGALARAVARRMGGSCSPWRLAAACCGGRLLAPGGPDLPSRALNLANTTRLWEGGP